MIFYIEISILEKIKFETYSIICFLETLYCTWLNLNIRFSYYWSKTLRLALSKDYYKNWIVKILWPSWSWCLWFWSPSLYSIFTKSCVIQIFFIFSARSRSLIYPVLCSIDYSSCDMHLKQLLQRSGQSSSLFISINGRFSSIIFGDWISSSELYIL